MNLRNLLKEINEAKQVGTLYHFTSYAKMIGIINDNFVLKSFSMDVLPYISFTRNKTMKSDTVSQNVRMTIDGDKLSEKYKISPYADTKGGYGRNLKNLGDEAEERIKIPEGKEGIQIKDCIKEIVILKPESHEPQEYEDSEPPSIRYYLKLMELLKEKNIPYILTSKYK